MSVARLLGYDETAIPDDSDLVGNPLWLAAYNQRLARLGVRLEEITADRGLTSRRAWIAVVDDGPSDHAVVARQNLVHFDPAGGRQGVLPRSEVRYGLVLARTRKIVPVFSPVARCGYTFVPA